MVNFASIISAVVGLAAIANAAPSLHKRGVSCRDDLGSDAYTPVSIPTASTKQKWPRTKGTNRPIANQASEAVECINYLASLGNQACVSTISGVNFCRRGNTQITGLTIGGKGRATSSW
jgi:hypothetical protein